MVREAIILAGGLGTRLREKVPGLPKCMAPVGKHPFLFYVINYLRSQGIDRVIFSLGYMNETIQDYLKKEFSTLDHTCSIESSPLGTGGAILQATSLIKGENCVIVNGDTLYKADLRKAIAFHEKQNADCTLLLKPMQEFERYGAVEMNNEGLITAFREKQYYKEGLINGGSYVLRCNILKEKNYSAVFSFEKDYLEKYISTDKIMGMTDDSYFIDIGIPEDYVKAIDDLNAPPLDLKKIDKGWTLFLDRDGVINVDHPGDYIRNLGMFEIYPDSLKAIAKFKDLFGKIIIVSNQRGITKGLMTLDDLNAIHDKLKEEVKRTGGRIDAIYYCTAMNDTELCRKPNPGMAFQAARDFPEIDLRRSIMVGNKITDMLFAENAGIYSVFVTTTNPETPFPHPAIDLRYDTLADFANSL